MKTLITLIAVLAPLAAHAQNFGVLEDDTQVTTVTAGAEHGLVVGLGYARVVPVAGVPVVVGGEAELQWAEVDVSDFRLRAGALVPIAGHGAWKLIGGLHAIARGTENDVARMINLGTDVSVLAGYYRPRWFAALEGGFDWALATHIDHSDAYRMQVYADVRDGWYKAPGGTFRYGVQSGVSFGGNDIVLRAGRMHDIDGDLKLFPFYATLGYGRRW